MSKWYGEDQQQSGPKKAMSLANGRESELSCAILGGSNVESQIYAFIK
jgi:hypothetical protein